MSIISTRRARQRSSCSGVGFRGFILRLEIAGFLPSQYKTLHARPNKIRIFSSKISQIKIVQGEL
ncbi:hypothetical protein, partial [Leisingera daeponensis]|uniref:hypothetical protein n=1 Tax=Leisingera daeponensis TaxID=405746 RepID=UPI001C97FAFA